MDPMVQEVVRRIAQEICPRRVILFGSRARGTARADSDIDLLVVYEGPLSKRDVKLRIRGLFPHPNFSMDLFVLTLDEFERQRSVVSTVGRTAAREGIVCHE